VFKEFEILLISIGKGETNSPSAKESVGADIFMVLPLKVRILG
jgi:hypothetical protein